MSEEPIFWADKHVNRILKLRDKEHFKVNGGISVSGPIHLGNMRADIIVPHTLKKLLERKGKEVVQTCNSYSQDPFKAKPTQLIWFEYPDKAKEMAGKYSLPKNYTPDPELRSKLKGRRLIDVPDPFDCHESWYHHFWGEFEKELPKFGVKELIEIPTSEFYQREDTKEAIKYCIENKEQIREILTKYQERKTFSEEWIPLVPWCPECKNIRGNIATEVDLDAWTVGYECDKCGKKGSSSIEDGKLPWRIEWATIWDVLEIDVEPYGKDHVVKGGSRDTSKEIQKKLYGSKPPYGFFCEWIGKKWKGKDLGDMTGTGNIVWTPKQWLEVASPEVFRYLYIGHKHTKRFVIDFRNIHQYVRRYDRAERKYFGEEEIESEKKRKHVKRSYELSQIGPIPKSKPLRIPYQYAAIIAQTVVKPEEELDKALYLLRKTGHVDHTLPEEDRERILKRLKRAKYWAHNYAPEKLRFELLEKFPKKLARSLSEKQKEALKEVAKILRKEDYGIDQLESKLFNIAEKYDLSFGQFFSAAYKLLIGKKSGPRLAPLLLSIKDLATKRFQQLS